MKYNVTHNGNQVFDEGTNYTTSSNKAKELRAIRDAKSGDFCENMAAEPIQIVFHNDPTAKTGTSVDTLTLRYDLRGMARTIMEMANKLKTGASRAELVTSHAEGVELAVLSLESASKVLGTVHNSLPH